MARVAFALVDEVLERVVVDRRSARRRGRARRRASARRASSSSASSSSGSSRNNVLRESNGPVSEKNGFSVVAPTSTRSPSSTNGSSTSCCAREKRCTSSRKRIVPWPRSPSRARARSATSRTSLTPALTALSVSNAFSLTPGDEPGDGRLAGAGRTPDDDRREPVRLDEHPQRLRRPEQVLLPDDLVERPRPQPRRERRLPRQPLLHRRSKQIRTPSHPARLRTPQSSQQLAAKSVATRRFRCRTPRWCERRDGALDDLAVRRRMGEHERQPSRRRQARSGARCRRRPRSAPVWNGKPVVLGEHLAVGPGEVGPVRLRADLHSVLLHRQRQPARRSTSEHVQLRPAPAGIEADPARREERPNDRHVAAGPGLESLGAIAPADAATRRRGAAVVEHSTELILAQERRAIAQRSLERVHAMPSRSTTSSSSSVPERCSADAAHVGAAIASDGDLVSILGSRFEAPQPRRGRVRRDRTVDRRARLRAALAPTTRAHRRVRTPEAGLGGALRRATSLRVRSSLELAVPQLIAASPNRAATRATDSNRARVCVHRRNRRNARETVAAFGCESVSPRDRFRYRTVGGIRG